MTPWALELSLSWMKSEEIENSFFQKMCFSLKATPDSFWLDVKIQGAYAHEKSEKIDFSGKLLRLTFGAF